MSWTIALVQMDCVAGDTAGQPVADCGSAPPRRLSVARNSFCSPNAPLPAISWPIVSPAWLNQSLAPPANGSRELARSTGVHLMVGMIERADGKYYDDAILFTPEGDHHVYRKTHLFGPERAIFTPGDKPVVVETVLGRLGLSVCYDLMFPEFIRSLVLSGAQIILNATDWITDAWQSSMGWSGDTVSSLVRIRALENGVHVAMADRAGVEAGWRSLGGSTVAAPTGRVLATLGADEGIATATIDLASADFARWSEVATYVRDRRPELYERSVKRA